MIELVPFIFYLACVSFVLVIAALTTKRLDQQQQQHQKELDEVRKQKMDLINRIMASSYAEYESFKMNGKTSNANTNFIKQSIDQAEKEYQQNHYYED